MYQYILRRIILFIITMLVLSMISYSVYQLSPASPFSGLLGWFSYLTNLYSLNLGVTHQGYPILDQLLIIFPATLELCFFGIFFALLIGLPVGIIAGMYQGKRPDTVISFIAMIGYSIPVFWLSMMVMMFVSNSDILLPMIERYNTEDNFNNVTGFLLIDAYLSDSPDKFNVIKDIIVHLFVPSIIAAFAPLTEIIRLTRNAVADVKQQNYIRTARVRGLNFFQIVFKRVLRNAIPQVIPKITIQLASILTYIMVVEYIFEWPGIGLWIFEAFISHDYIAIQAAILVLGTFVLLVNVASDILGILINPLIRKQWNAIQ